jgi:AhpD family alkylhydroperoxidase
MTSYSAAGAARGPVWALPGALSRLRPEACGLLAAVNERAWQACDPGRLELVRARTAQLIGNDEALRVRGPYPRAATEAKVRAVPDYPTSPLFSPAERETLAFAEQFVIDVAGTAESARDGLVRRLGADGARALVSAIYVVEFTQRLQMVAARLLGRGDGDGHGPAAEEEAVGDGPAAEKGAAADGPTAEEGAAADGPTAEKGAAADATLAGLLAAYQAAVVRGSVLDPVTTELVRLRCARTHQCRICQTLRLADARAAGVDEAMTAQVDFYERSNLPERAKVALRVTDAFITRPDMLSDAAAGQARASFGPAELASLCLDITKWSTQKIHVALGTDGAGGLETDEDGVAVFGFDEAGRPDGLRRRRS